MIVVLRVCELAPKRRSIGGRSTGRGLSAPPGDDLATSHKKDWRSEPIGADDRSLVYLRLTTERRRIGGRRAHHGICFIGVEHLATERRRIGGRISADYARIGPALHRSRPEE